jgi:hypothetical protein
VSWRAIVVYVTRIDIASDLNIRSNQSCWKQAASMIFDDDQTWEKSETSSEPVYHDATCDLWNHDKCMPCFATV